GRRRAGGSGGGRVRSGRGGVAGVGLGLQITAAVLSLAVLIGSGFAWATYRNFSSNIKRVNISAGDTSTAKKNNIDGKDQNILIVGNDDRDSATAAELKELSTTKDGGSYNTDTMMLMHIPANGSKATIISFPRDSYVAIPGHGMNKLNAAYPFGVQDDNGNKAGGAQLLVKTIENMTGLSIDHFVQVDLLGFYRISNAIGGVTICLNNAMKEPNSGIDLPKGVSTIEGQQALAFVRQRYGFPDGLGDLDRIKRQQYFLSAVFRKMASAGTLLNPFKLQNLLNAVTQSLTMDSSLNPLKLAQQMQNLTAGNVSFTTIPTNGFADEGAVGSVVVVNTAAIPDFVQNLIGTSAADALKAAKAAAPSSVTVSVVNDADADGLETTNAAALATAGFKTVVPPATSAVLAKTTIEYPSGMESQAKAVQAEVPQAVMLRTSAVTSVTLALGNNGVQVKSLMPTVVKPSTSSTAPAPTASSSGPAVTTAADAGCID
ncbi:MAG: LytR family transcriptional regulator, partial [Frankiales bacterium]|nr:LytR family transcriptional regulator [Frankiales bacterium]